jgi:hypothetical protein
MFNMKARTEINDALTCIVLAETGLARSDYDGAAAAIHDAECHYRSARSAVTIEKSDSILENLSMLRIRLDRLQLAVNRKSAAVSA